jgi:hypothetical protein
VEDSSYWFGHRNARIVELVRQFPPNGLIFDIGGGNGFVAKGLEEAGFATVVNQRRALPTLRSAD